MLDDRQRIDRYLAQSGRMELTPRQRRRVNHKRGHQSALASGAREVKAEEKATRSRLLLPSKTT